MADPASTLNPQFADFPDEELVRRIVAGHSELFEVLVRRHSGRLYRAAISILRNTAEAEDVVQDAFISAFQYLHQFAGRAKFSTWLTRIAVHRALECASRGRREQALDGPEGEPGTWPVSRARDPEDCAAAVESAALLRDALHALPPAYRDVLIIRYLEDVNTADAAARLRISESNVKVRLHRACAMLRRQLTTTMRTDACAA